MLNHIVIMGRLTKDPELRTTQSSSYYKSLLTAASRVIGLCPTTAQAALAPPGRQARPADRSASLRDRIRGCWPRL